MSSTKPTLSPIERLLYGDEPSPGERHELAGELDIFRAERVGADERSTGKSALREPAFTPKRARNEFEQRQAPQREMP